MLAFLGVLLIGLPSPQAQVRYNFQSPDQITISGAPVALPMDCLAANGYGQWTSSSTSLGESNLLTNMLASTGEDNAQDGVLSDNGFAFSIGDSYPTADAIKCAANLKGNVRYVWLNAARNAFYVEGFDPGAAGIDISFMGLPSVTSIVNAPALTATTFSLLSTHTVVNSIHESNPLDRFDVAIDASNLYIVWEEFSASKYSVWAMVIDLSTGLATMTPTQVTPSTGGGRRPTVAVDIRNSGSVAPFDVVCLSQTLGSTSMDDTSNVWWTQYISGTSFTTPVAIPTSFGFSINWDAPLHARIVDASEAGLTPATSTTYQRGIYIIAQTNYPSSSTPGYQHLFLDYIYNAIPFTTCEYCDGFNNTTRPTSPPCPVNVPGGANTYSVDDNPIWAFANPYEGANSNSLISPDFTEFHCLYQLNRSGAWVITPAWPPNNPLMIIRGNDVAHGFCVNGNGSASFWDDPGTNSIGFADYCGAVNQMGVHVHWCSAATHYYRRDRREFDQNIEENTLLTDECDVGNTKSGVGISDPTVLSNLYFTLYTDPSTAVDPFPDGVCFLDFDDGAALNIGSISNSGSDFVMIGPDFDPLNPCPGIGQLPGVPDPFTCSANSWAINFAADNSMDHYNSDVAFLGDGQFTLTGSGETMTSTVFGNYVSSISDPVTWTIHNTSLDLDPCSVTNCINIMSTDSKIDFKDDIIDYPSSLITHCDGTFTNCQFVSDPSSISFGTSIRIDGNGSWDGTTGLGDGNFNASDYFLAANHTVNFISCYSDVGIFVGSETSPAPASFVVQSGLYEKYNILCGDYTFYVSPWWPISISDATFDKITGQAIIVGEGNPPADLGSINQAYSIIIDHNDFKTFDSGTGLYGISPYSSGILVAYAPDASLDDALRQDITVTNNVFESAGSEEQGSIWAAIHFMDATGDIGFNQITTDITLESKYQRGIWNESSNVLAPSNTWTFICSNKVSGLTESEYSAALQTDYYTGYVKLDTFTNSANGQISGYHDNGHIDYSLYENNGNDAYMGLENSQTDLAGIHFNADGTPNPDDLPALNVFATTLADDPEQQINLVDGAAYVFLGLQPGSPTWTVYGENNITGSPIDVSTGHTLYDISNNYWGGASYYPTSIGTGGYLTSAPSNPGFVCSSGLRTKRKGSTPPSTLKVDTIADSTQSGCGSQLTAGYILESQNEEPEGYDTLRAFLEDCPLYPNSAEAFSMAGSAISAWTTGGQGRWPDFLTWLKKVLYYNPDTSWYCEDVSDMIAAEQYNAAAVMSICQYIIASGKCQYLAMGFAENYNAAANARHMSWLDSVYHLWPLAAPYWNDSVKADTTAHPFNDTAVPTLQQDSLEILLGPQYAGVQSPSPITSQALLSAQLIENPVVTDEIDISYQMGRTALVTMELRDILGRSVPLSYAKYQLESPGPHEATIPAPSLPSGTYYLRLTTDAGDAITLKVVKE